MTARSLKRVLYIDDDADIREIAVTALELIGELEVDAFASGVEALSSEAPGSPDLLLLDVMMPNVDGPATLALLRRDPRFASAPAVFFTAKGSPADIEALMRLGAAGVVRKPFDPATLADQLRQVMAGDHAC